jgi:hypothetical protein
MYDDYVWTQSTARVERFWPQLQRYWQNVLADLRPDGVWTGSCLNDIRITPGCPAGSRACASGMITPWVIERLRFSVEMAQAIQQDAQAQAWQAAADAMVAAFPKVFLIPASGNVPAHVAAMAWLDGQGAWHPFGSMQASNTVAIFTDLVPADVAGPAMAYLFPDADGTPPAGVSRWNNPTYLRRSLKALSHVNRTGTALRHLKERFQQYLVCPSSPKIALAPRPAARRAAPGLLFLTDVNVCF